MSWFALALLCAFALAAADAGSKRWLQGASAGEITLVRFGWAGLLVAPIAFSAPWPAIAEPFWRWFLLLAPLEIGAMLVYMRAIRDYPLGLTLPYLAFTPVFVTLTGWLVLGETVDRNGLLGILLVVAGSWLLHLDVDTGGAGANAGVAHAAVAGGRAARAGRLPWRRWGRMALQPLRHGLSQTPTRLMLGVATIYSLTAVFSKAAMAGQPPMIFGARYFVLVGAATVLVIALPRPGSLRVLWRWDWRPPLIGALMGLMVVTHFAALAQVETAYMITVKRTSLLFGILFGAWLFQEDNLRRHLASASLMLGGIALILL